MKHRTRARSVQSLRLPTPSYFKVSFGGLRGGGMDSSLQTRCTHACNLCTQVAGQPGLAGMCSRMPSRCWCSHTGPHNCLEISNRHQQCELLSLCHHCEFAVCSCRAYTLPNGDTNAQPAITYEDGIDWGNGFVGQYDLADVQYKNFTSVNNNIGM